jgi:hypothetical protein
MQILNVGDNQWVSTVEQLSTYKDGSSTHA